MASSVRLLADALRLGAAERAAFEAAARAGDAVTAANGGQPAHRKPPVDRSLRCRPTISR
jgi:hypothetical protein